MKSAGEHNQHWSSGHSLFTIIIALEAEVSPNLTGAFCPQITIT